MGNYHEPFLGEGAVVMPRPYPTPPFPADENISQSFGHLTAIKLDGSDYHLISEERGDAMPTVAPDGSRVVYMRGGEVYAWYADGTEARLNFGAFRSGAISPDSKYIALNRFELPDEPERIDILDLESGAQIASTTVDVPTGDGFSPPVWNANSQQIATNAVDWERDGKPFFVRLQTIDGTERDISALYNPVFSPDGDWLAGLENVDNSPVLTVFHLATGQRSATDYSDTPLAWVALPSLKVRFQLNEGETYIWDELTQSVTLDEIRNDNPLIDDVTDWRLSADQQYLVTVTEVKYHH